MIIGEYCKWWNVDNGVMLSFFLYTNISLVYVLAIAWILQAILGVYIVHDFDL